MAATGNKATGYNKCMDILNSCWNGMQNNKEDWFKVITAFGQVCERTGNDPDVSLFAVKCTELLELKFKEVD